MTREKRETPNPQQHKGKLLLSQLAELQDVLSALNPQPAAGKLPKSLSFRRRSA